MQIFNELTNLGTTGSLLANLIWLPIVGGILYFKKKIEKKYGSSLSYLFNSIFLNKKIFFVATIILIFVNIIQYQAEAIFWLFYTNCSFYLFIWFAIYQLNTAGVYGADEKIKNGLDYLTILKLTKDDFKFIGTGASKLTENKEAFKDCIRRVNSAGKVPKFILCDENSIALEKLAQQANISKDDYKKNVRNSRELLETLKEEGLKIEIRKYNVDEISLMPIFRLTLINGNFSVVSYSLFNDPKHKGEELSQVHLCDSKNSRGYSVSLYHGFEKYFDNLWNELGDK